MPSSSEKELLRSHALSRPCTLAHPLLCMTSAYPVPCPVHSLGIPTAQPLHSLCMHDFCRLSDMWVCSVDEENYAAWLWLLYRQVVDSSGECRAMGAVALDVSLCESAANDVLVRTSDAIPPAPRKHRARRARRRNKAATKIQSAARGKQGRRKSAKRQASVVKLQSARRGQLARREAAKRCGEARGQKQVVQEIGNEALAFGSTQERFGPPGRVQPAEHLGMLGMSEWGGGGGFRSGGWSYWGSGQDGVVGGEHASAAATLIQRIYRGKSARYSLHPSSLLAVDCASTSAALLPTPSQQAHRPPALPSSSTYSALLASRFTLLPSLSRISPLPQCATPPLPWAAQQGASPPASTDPQPTHRTASPHHSGGAAESGGPAERRPRPHASRDRRRRRSPQTPPSPGVVPLPPRPGTSPLLLMPSPLRQLAFLTDTYHHTSQELDPTMPLPPLTALGWPAARTDPSSRPPDLRGRPPGSWLATPGFGPEYMSFAQTKAVSPRHHHFRHGDGLFSVGGTRGQFFLRESVSLPNVPSRRRAERS